MNTVFRELLDRGPDRHCERLLDTPNHAEAIRCMMAHRTPGVLVWVETNGLPKSWKEIKREVTP